MQTSFVDKNVDKLMQTIMQTLIVDKNVDYTSVAVINEEILMQTEIQTSVVEKNVDIIGNIGENLDFYDVDSNVDSNRRQKCRLVPFNLSSLF